MAAAAASISVSPPFLFSLFLKPNHPISSNSRKSHPVNLIASQWPSTRNIPSRNPPSATPLNGKRWKLPALRETTLFLLDTTPVEESAQETMLESDPVISVLIIVAFVGLSVLTIGVIYIAVADFLQKREKEKFEKEEATKQKKKKGKIRTRARAGPRGFGQKIEEEIDELTE